MCLNQAERSECCWGELVHRRHWFLHSQFHTPTVSLPVPRVDTWLCTNRSELRVSPSSTVSLLRLGKRRGVWNPVPQGKAVVAVPGGWWGPWLGSCRSGGGSRDGWNEPRSRRCPEQSRASPGQPGALTAAPALQLMQQQTTVLSTSHGSYLSPGVAFSPCHIQQIGAVSLNGLPAAPIAPASGEGLHPASPSLPANLPQHGAQTGKTVPGSLWAQRLR